MTFTILAVDDTEINIDILSRIFKEYNLIPARDGEDALKIVHAQPVDIVLLDILMPGIDGLEVCRKLKSDERTKKIPVIFVTVKNTEQYICKAFEAGGADFVAKPFNPAEIFARVQIQLSRRDRDLCSDFKNMEEIEKLKNDECHQGKDTIYNAWKQSLTELRSINDSLLTPLQRGEKVDDIALKQGCLRSEYILRSLQKSLGM